MQAVILAAGLGVRLKPLTDHTPKAMIDLCGKPLLEYTLRSLPNTIDEIFIVVNYLRDQIEERFGTVWHNKPIHYKVQDPLTGTGGALHLLKNKLNGRFLVVNGDDLYAQADLEALIQHDLAILVSTTSDRIRAGAILKPDGTFARLGELDEPTNYRICGAYVLDQRFFDYPLVEIQVGSHKEFGLPQTLAKMTVNHPISIEKATFWFPVGTYAELEKAQHELSTPNCG